MDTMSVLIKSTLQEPSDADINKLKSKIQQKLNNINIRSIKVLDETEISRYQQHFQDMLDKFKNSKIEVFNFSGMQQGVNDLSSALNSLSSGGSKDSIKDLNSQFETVQKTVKDVTSTSILQLSGALMNCVSASGSLGKGLLGLIPSLAGVIKVTDTSAASLKSLSSLSLSSLAFMNVGLLAVSAAITAVVGGIISYINTQKQLKEQAQEAAKAQGDFNQSISDFHTSLDTSKLDAAAQNLGAVKKATNYDENIEKMQQLKDEINKLESNNRQFTLLRDGKTPSFGIYDSEIANKKEALADLEKKVGQVTEAERKYNDEKEIAKALDVNAVQSNLKSIATKVQEINADKKLVEQYEASVQQGKEDVNIKNQLLQKYPTFLKYMDDGSGSLGINTQALNENLDIQKSLALVEIIEAKASMQTSYEKTQQVIKDTEARIQALQSEKDFMSELDRINQERYGNTILFESDTSGIDAKLEEAKKKLEQAKNASSIYEGILNKSPEDIYNTYALSANSGSNAYTPPPDSGESASSQPEQFYETYTPIEKDPYMGLNQVLNDVNNALELNRALQEQSGNTNIDLLNEQISLLGKKRKAINDITWEQKMQANNDRWSLETARGIKFDENGNIDQASYYALIDQKEAGIMSLPSGKDRDAEIQDLENLKNTAEEYIDLITNQIPQNNLEMVQIGSDIADTEAKKSEAANAQLENTRRLEQSDRDKRLAQLQGAQAEITEGSDEWRDNLNQQIEVHKENQAVLEAEAQEIDKQLAGLDKQSDAYVELKQKRDDLSKTWWNEQQAIKAVNESITEYETNTVENAQNKLIDILKAFEEKRHKQKIDNIDAEIAKLDELYAKEDYDKNIQQQDKAIAAKQAEINALALDNSAEANARRAELQAGLDDLLLKKSDDVEQHKRDSSKKTLEKLKTDEDKRYEEATNDAALFNQTQQDLTNMTVGQIMDKYTQMGQVIGGVYDTLTQKAELFNSVQQAKPIINNPDSSYNQPNKLIENYNNSNISNSSSNNANADVDGTILDKIAALKDKYYAANSASEQSELIRQAEELRKRLPSDVAQATRELSASADIRGYKKGLTSLGRVYDEGGAIDYTGLAWVDGSRNHPEYLLKSVDFKSLLDTINISKAILPMMQRFMPGSVDNSKRMITIEKVETNVYSAPGMDESRLADLVEKRIFNNIGTRIALNGV